MTTPPSRKPPPFSEPLFGLLAAQHAAWKQGVSPTRKPRGYSGQNPHLLSAFDALDRAERRAADHWRKQTK